MPCLALIPAPAHVIGQKLALGDLGRHPDELLLHELESCDRTVELDPLPRIVEGCLITGHSCAQAAPGDTVAGVIQAHKW